MPTSERPCRSSGCSARQWRSSQADKIIFNRGYGVRDTATGDVVTANTRFRIGSNTKSMTSLLIAKYVDQGLCSWDSPVIDLWPGFLGPTPALTSSLTLAQMLGMGSGIAEPETIEFFAAGGGVSAEELLQTIAHLEVVADDGRSISTTTLSWRPLRIWSCWRTELLPADLDERYANDLASLVFDPSGWTTPRSPPTLDRSVRITPPATRRTLRAQCRAVRS